MLQNIIDKNNIVVYNQIVMDILKKEGGIFFIPLFLPLDIKENTKNYGKYKFSKNELYAFGRLIEIDMSGGDLVEIFKFVGNIPNDNSIIINSGLLFEPIHISLGFYKKRWQFIFEDINYDKIKDSNYRNITFLLGSENNPELWEGGKITEIKHYDKNKYNEWIVYPPTKVEKMIKENKGII
jgi:hypothetical protein